MLDKFTIKKLGMSVVVAAGFLFFWINGPLQVDQNPISLREQKTPFSKPLFIHQKTTEHKSTSYIDTDEEEEKFGTGLITSKKKSKGTATSKVIVADHLENHQTVEGSEFVSHARKLFPEGSEFKLIESTSFYFVQFINHGETVFYTESQPFVHGVLGYAGEINVGVLYNDDDQIAAVYHVSSQETESYLKKITKQGYYSQYKNIPLYGEHTVDGISGATITSQALAQTVTELSNQTKPHLPITGEEGHFLVEAKLTLWWILDLVIIAILFAYGIFKKVKSKRNTRIVQFASVIYIGFFMNSSFSYTTFVQPFIGTTISTFLGLYGLFVLLGSIWEKNIYCKYVCPFACAQKICSIATKPYISTSKLPLSSTWLKQIRGTLTVVLLLGLLLGLRSWGNFELFPDLFSANFINLYFLLSVAFLLINAKYPMFWCRVLCPTGSVLDGITDFIHLKKKKK